MRHKVKQKIRQLPFGYNCIKDLTTHNHNSTRVVRELQSHKARPTEHRLKLGMNYHNNGLLFPRLDGNPLDPRDLSKEFKKLIEKAGLPENTRLHDLRHTHVTQLMLMDEHIIKAQHRMGHATIQQTAEYTHLVANMQDGISEKLSALLNIIDIDKTSSN